MKESFGEFLGDILAVLVITGILVVGFVWVATLPDKYPTTQEILAFHAKYNCIRTGEFVGKYATPVYDCNGLKFKDDELDAMVYREKNK